MKKILKLQDHKHTAKHLPHHHTSYRALFLLILLFGVCLLFVQRNVNADSYVVSARVAAPIPTVAAEITQPTAGSVLTEQNIIISGNCPIIIPAVIVELYRNDQLLGSSLCTNDGTFSGTYSLVGGTNRLQPKVRTITDDYGPVGVIQTVTVLQATTTQTTTPVSVNTQTTSTVTPTEPQFEIKTEKPYIVFKQNESTVWKVTIAGGTSPYSIVVDWGDGTKSTYAASTAGEQLLEHVFKQSKSAVVKISVKDANGKEVYTSVAGITFKPVVTPSVNGIATENNGSVHTPLATLWVTYAFVLAIIAAFWADSHMPLRHPVRVNTKKKKPHKK